MERNSSQFVVWLAAKKMYNFNPFQLEPNGLIDSG